MGPTGTNTGDGAPSVRLKGFVEAFGARGLFESICAADFGPAMEHIARTLIPDVVPCVSARLYDRDLALAGVQPDCAVSEEIPRELGEAPLEIAVPSCDIAGGATPCWRVGPDARCAASPEGMAIIIDHGAVAASPNTHARWSCRGCAASDTTPSCLR
jgi:hypothetical protein